MADSLKSSLEALIRAEEGCRLKPYRCSAGKLTIGIGRNLEDKGISESEAELMFANDLAEVKGQISAALPWASTLDEVRYAVLCSMAFQMGIYGLLGFKQTLAAVFREDWDEASRRMLKSKWAREDTPKRARRHAIMMRRGEWL